MSDVSQPPGTDQETVSAAQASSSKRLRLLLIQHDPRARISLWDKFKNAGFEVDLAANPHLAFDKFRIATPDAIFIDLVPANAKALEIIKEARRIKTFATRPIYVCTTADYLATAKRGAKTATKVFDKAATSLDEMVADLAKSATECRNEAAAQAESKPAPKSKKAASAKFSLNPFNLLKRKKEQSPPLVVPASAGPAPAESVDSQIATAPAPSDPPLAVPASADTPAQTEQRSNTPQPVPEQSKIENPKPKISPAPSYSSPTGRPVVGVFTVDAGGKILSADAPAARMFGWSTTDLVGEELKVLLKHGCEGELVKIVQQGGNSSNQLISVRVTARTKDGIEFPASITRLAWSSDTVHLAKSAHIQYTWTAVFRDLSAGATTAAGASGNTSFLPREMKELAESRETQAILRGANQALQKQLEVMSAKVAASQEAAEKAQKHRDQLKARVEALETEAARARSALDQQTKTHQSNDSQLRHLSTEKFELEQHVAEHGRTKQQLERVSAELNDAKSAAARAEATAKEEAARARTLQDEITQLRQAHDELKTRVTADSKQQADQVEARLRETTAELERIRAERAQLESALRESADELNRAKAERAKNSQEAAHASELQAQLTTVRAALETADQRIKDLENDRLEVGDRFVTEKEAADEAKRRNQQLETELQQAVMALQQLKAERDEQAQRTAAASELQAQLDAIKADAEEKETTLKESTARAKRLERDVANLREERHELHTRCTVEKQAGTKSKRRIKELEKQLREIASAFATTKQELEKRAATRGRLESDLQGELDAAKAAQHEQTVRANLLERELGQVCEIRDELRAELEVEQHKLLVASQRLEDLETRLRETVAELARAKAAAENHAAMVQTPQPAFEGADDLVKDLHRLRENEAAYKAEVAELERRVRDSVTSLARVTADLETERSERRRVEQRLSTLTTQLEQMHLDLKQHLESERANQTRVTDLEQQLRDHQRALVRARADLQKESANRELAEQQLQAVGDMGAQLRQYLSLFEESKKVFKRTQEQLEAKLTTTQNALGEAEAKLQKELAERRGLEASLTAAHRSVNDQYEQKVLELARLQSELQVEQLERKRLEGDAHQSRYASLDSARVARSTLNTLRRQLHDSVDALMTTTRRLLEITSEAEQKKLVQSVLESALLLQSALDDTGTDPELRSAA
jgi:PAS domain S-box-containing protein